MSRPGTTSVVFTDGSSLNVHDLELGGSGLAYFFNEAGDHLMVPLTSIRYIIEYHV